MQSLWQVSHAPAYYNETIVPKGIIEIIFNFSEGETGIATINGQQNKLPNCFISGFCTQPIQVKLPGQQVFFGVLLQPFAVQQIFGMPAGELANATIDLALMDKNINYLWEEIYNAQTFTNRVGVVLQWLRKYFFVPQPRETFIHNFLTGSISPDYSAGSLARELCYSPRQLSRKMTVATGLNTETILLYKKYLQALKLIHHSPLSLTAIAYECGFSDQSHFIKSFKAFTNLTPGKYKESKSPVMAHLYQDVR